LLTILIVAILTLMPALLTNCTSKEQEGSVPNKETSDGEDTAPDIEEEITPEESDNLVTSVDSNFISSNAEFGFSIFKELHTLMGIDNLF